MGALQCSPMHIALRAEPVNNLKSSLKMSALPPRQYVCLYCAQLTDDSVPHNCMDEDDEGSAWIDERPASKKIHLESHGAQTTAATSTTTNAPHTRTNRVVIDVDGSEDSSVSAIPHAACPICSKSFKQSLLEAHVNECLDAASDAAVSQTSTTAHVGTSLDAAIDVEEMTGSLEAAFQDENAQKEALEQLEARRLQEEKDARLAVLLADGGSLSQETGARGSPVLLDGGFTVTTYRGRRPPPGSSQEDILLMQEELERQEAEERKKLEETDRKLAMMLEQEEREEEQKRQTELEKRELEGELEAMRRQLAEREAEMARIEAERIALREAATDAPSAAAPAVVLQGVEYPDTWLPQGRPFELFQVQRGTAEWDLVQGQFDVDNNRRVPIQRIERIQNQTLFAWYFLRRAEVTAKNQGNAQERFLFHGSRNNMYERILREGFDHRVANLGGAIGAGTYFGVNSQISMGYVDNSNLVLHRKGRGRRNQHHQVTHRRMLVCRVTLGRDGPGKSGLRKPPLHCRSNHVHSANCEYDSVHGSIAGRPRDMFCIFDNRQAYPEYMIYF